jgi:1,4-alpha-glucan branching enzyme
MCDGCEKHPRALVDTVRLMSSPGELAIVLHTHMPYVEGGGEWPPVDQAEFMRNPEGFGTWPFGEEWLWEAIATSYVPLLEVLDRAPLTLSLTPVLCDQLAHPGAIERCIEFLEGVRPETHRRDAAELRAAGKPLHASVIELSAGDYAAAAIKLRQLGPGGLLRALGDHVSWTSAATHAVLPLLATDAGVALQVQTGVASHRRRFGHHHGGFWLPECGYAPWLAPLLEEAGVRAVCVELTNLFGLGDERHLRPIASDDGPVLWPCDRETIALVWGVRGYPAHGAYRDYHGYTTHRHHAWRNDGAAYDRDAARAQAGADAREFVAHVSRRVRSGGVCVFALDTELLGHWWFEGVWWLEAVLDEATRQGLKLTTLDDALERHEPSAPSPVLPVGSWGEGGDLRTWSGPRVAELAWAARTAELRLNAAVHPPARALRELLALQSSDWAFLVSRATAGDYPLQRARGHLAAFDRALAGDDRLEPALRGLAPDLF